MLLANGTERSAGSSVVAVAALLTKTPICYSITCPSSLAIDHSLPGLGVPCAPERDRRGGILDITEVTGRQLDRRRPDVFFESLDLPSPRDRNDPRLLSQQPRQCNLRRSRFLALGDSRENINDSLIRRAVLGCEAWDRVTEVGAVERRRLVDPAREEAFPQRTEGNEADAERFAGRQNFILWLSPPE